MKPRIVCHMMASVDGRIDCTMTEQLGGVDEYYETLDALGAPSRLSGRVTATLEMADEGFYQPENPEQIGKTAFFKAADAKDGYTVVVDTLGRLQFSSDILDDKPLLLVVSEMATLEYLRYLENLKISWIAVGKERIDLGKAVEIMYDEFGIHDLAIVGGPHINGSFLREGLLDEVSILIGPGIDGREGLPGVFEGMPADSNPAQLKLTSVQQYGDGAVWLRYELLKG